MATHSIRLRDYKAVFEAVPGLYLVLAPDARFTIVAVSDAYLRATRTTREGILGRGIFEILPDAPEATGLRHLRASIGHVVEHRRAHTMAIAKYHIRKPESEGGGFEERYWCPLNAPVIGPEGRLRYIIHHVEDVTEYVRMKEGGKARERMTEEMRSQAERMEAEICRRAEEVRAINRKLDESEQHVREIAAIVESSDDAIVGMRLDGTITSWNKGAEQIFGYTVAEAIGRPSRILIPTERQGEETYILDRIRGGQRLHHFETVRLTKDGRPVEVSLAVSPIEDSRGRVIGASKIARDVTEWHRAAEEVRRAKEAAETASRAKDRLLAVLSHELRTPLSPVVMAVAAMENAPGLSGAVREDVRMMRRNLELETKLIDDLLDVSRAISGKLRLHRQPTHVHEMLRHVYDICCADLEGKRLRVRWELGATNDLVNADPARLQQVFWNLLKNATQFTPEGRGVTLRTADAGGGRIRVEVEDEGAGIRGEELLRIFDPFAQGEACAAGGMGLGLAISKAVIDMHGGSIRAASAGEGRGATFTVELENVARPAGVPAAREVAAGVGPDERAVGKRRYRMLLVEDHIDSARTLARLLRRSGYDVRVADCAHSALDLAEHEHFDIIVSDIGLPDGSGCDLMREVRRHQDIKGIALSGFGMEEDIRRSHEAGFVDHVVKPISVDRLQGVIGRVLGTG